MIFAITWSINIQVLPSYSNICLSATPSQNGMSGYFLWPRVLVHAYQLNNTGLYDSQFYYLLVITT